MAKEFEKEEFPTFFIPYNYDDDGKVLDLFNKRNLMEGAVVGILPAFLLINLKIFDTGKTLLIVLLVCLPLFLIAAIGINGDPVSVFIKNVYLYLKNKKHNKMRFKRVDKSENKNLSKNGNKSTSSNRQTTNNQSKSNNSKGLNSKNNTQTKRPNGSPSNSNKNRPNNTRPNSTSNNTRGSRQTPGNRPSRPAQRSGTSQRRQPPPSK